MGKDFFLIGASKEQTRPERPALKSREWLASLSEFRAWFGVG